MHTNKKPKGCTSPGSVIKITKTGWSYIFYSSRLLNLQNNSLKDQRYGKVYHIKSETNQQTYVSQSNYKAANMAKMIFAVTSIQRATANTVIDNPDRAFVNMDGNSRKL